MNTACIYADQRITLTSARRGRLCPRDAQLAEGQDSCPVSHFLSCVVSLCHLTRLPLLTLLGPVICVTKSLWEQMQS